MKHMKRRTLHTTLSSSLPIAMSMALVSSAPAFAETDVLNTEMSTVTHEVVENADADAEDAFTRSALKIQPSLNIPNLMDDWNPISFVTSPMTTDGSWVSSLLNALLRGKDRSVRMQDTPVGAASGSASQGGSDDGEGGPAKARFPLNASVSLTNSVGTGTFAPGYTNNPWIQSALSIRPSFNVPKLLGDWQPTTSISASIAADIQWASSFTGAAFTGTYERQVRVRDFRLAAVFPGLIREPFSGISVSPAFTMAVPLSVFSRYQNRLLGFGASLPVAWSLPTALGNFSVSYRGGGNAWATSEKAATLPCGDQQQTNVFSIGQDPTSGLAEEPGIFTREGEVSEVNGQCIVRGRQIVASVINSGSMSWSYPDFFGSHALSLGMGVYHLIGRPLTDPGESTASQWSNRYTSILGNNTPTELTDGSISYTYGVPVDLNLSITAGIYSLQNMFDPQNNFRFPWFDFNEQAGNNFTTGFVTMSLAL